jgi:hypothetical protein
MGFLIYQYYETKNSTTPEFVEYSKKSIQTYANKIGAEYKFYDAICFIDSDVLSNPKNIENIFNSYNKDKISLHHMNTGPLVVDPIESTGVWKNTGHGNSGVVIFPKKCYKHFIEYLGDLSSHWKNNKNELGSYDQLIVNNYTKDNEFTNLDFRFNYHLGRYDHNLKDEQVLIHYHLNNKKYIVNEYMRLNNDKL